MPAFKAHRQSYVNLDMGYSAVGSGNGKNQIKGIVDGVYIDYAGSDSLLSEEDYAAYPDLVMFPTMAGYVIIN